MRKIILIMICLILLVAPLVSAADWDNVLDYSEDDLKVTISNTFLLLFQTSDIGTAELKSHSSVNEVVKYGAGNQIVMWYDFDFLGLYENGLGEIEFTDMRTGEVIDRDYSFVYWGEKERDVYGQGECSFSVNGTQTCERIVVGKETYNDWLPYNSKDIPKGNIRIGLMTYVEIDDKVDGIWTIAGKRIKKHAAWTSALNVGLRSYYKFDGDVNDSLGINNGTTKGTADNPAGIINNGRYFDGVNDNITLGDMQGASWSNFTFNVWVNYTGTDDECVFANFFDGSDRSFTWWITHGTSDDNMTFTGSFNGENSGIEYPSNVVVPQGALHMLTVTYDDPDLRLYYDGVNVGNHSKAGGLDNNTALFTIGFPTLGAVYMEGIVDELGIWLRGLTGTEIYDVLWNGGAANQWTDVFGLDVTLLLPEDNTDFATNTITFSTNVSDINVVGIQNVTIKVFNSTGLIFDETNTSTFEGVYNFSDTFIDGDYDWNVTAYDDADALTSSSTRSFSIDATDPVISVIYPNETITFHELNTNLSLNWSINDTHLDSCWFNWNSSNVSVTCNDNSTTFNITDGTVKTLTFYANDTFGNEASQINTWNYRLFFNYEIFDNEVIESLSTTFSANFLTNGSTITLANLSYNSSGNTGTINDHGGNNFTVTKTITTPSVSAKTNISFYWNITQGTMYYALDEQNQTILNLEIDNCTANSEVLYNFTIVNEETQAELIAAGNNTDAKVDIEVRGFGTTTLIEQFNESYSQKNPFAVCFNSTEGQFNIDVQIQYNADNYEIEFYHIQNATINSTDFPTNITLFDLNSSDSQLFKLIVKDSSFLAIKDALVEVHRKYIDEGVFKIVEIPRTDGRGETAAHLVIQDAIYKFIIKKYGVTIATFENVIAVCQTPLVAPCVIDFNAFAETVEVPDFEEAEDFLFTLGFNSTSRVISSVFSIPSGTPSVIAIEVIKEDALGTSVCTDTLTSSSGTLNCDVGTSVGNSTVLAKIYKDGDLQAQGQVKLDNSPISIYGGVLVILALFIMMTLIGAGISDNPVYTVLFLMVGVILLFALNLVASNGFIGATATILWLIVAVIFIIIKGGRRS